MPDAISALAHLLTTGHHKYVHCTAELGRAPLTVFSYLILVEGFTPNDAIRLKLEGRPGAVPAWEALYGACDDLVALHRDVIKQRAYQRHEMGIHSESLADWNQAQAEVLRSTLTAGPIKGGNYGS